MIIVMIVMMIIIMKIMIMMMCISIVLDDLRRRTDLSCRDSMVGRCCLLSSHDVRGQRSPIADSITVPEQTVLPLGQRSAVAKLRAAGSEGWAAVGPLDPL